MSYHPFSKLSNKQKCPHCECSYWEEGRAHGPRAGFGFDTLFGWVVKEPLWLSASLFLIPNPPVLPVHRPLGDLPHAEHPPPSSIRRCRDPLVRPLVFASCLRRTIHDHRPWIIADTPQLFPNAESRIMFSTFLRTVLQAAIKLH